MGKAIKCTITGLEIPLLNSDEEASFYYVARMRPDEIARVSKVLENIKKDDIGPYAAVFDTVREAQFVLKTIKATLRANNPKNIYWSINRLAPEHQNTNNRISLKNKTRSIGS